MGDEEKVDQRQFKANKCDLSHMRAVKSEVHNRFADENALYSFMMSAKSGDQVVVPSASPPCSNTSFASEIEVTGSVPAYTKSALRGS
ncbi:GTPase [Aureococcus anophagefferens]|nr:GTPase [Aureococcus anophagefferens]